MSSLAKRISKEVRNKWRFEPTMYMNTVGSILICACIFDNRNEIPKVNKKWRKLLKHPSDFNVNLDDPELVEKTLAYFDLIKPDNFPIARVESDFNVLYAPYVDKTLYPLREDGYFSKTLREGKIV